MHAELVIAAGARMHLADRSSANGTWIDAGGGWERVTQRTVAEGDRLRFGSCVVGVAELLHRAVGQDGQDDHAVAGAAQPGADGDKRRSADDLPSGRVRRNPETGEIIAD